MKKMNIIVASDSYKGSLSSIEVANTMEQAFLKLKTDFNIKKFAIADGGEGTVEALTTSLNGKFKSYEVYDVFMRKTNATLGELDESSCIIETASPCGLNKLEEHEYNPMKATSFGLGQMIIYALDSGMKRLYIGLGGSSVNDGGMGLAKALGVKITNAKGESISDGALGLKEVENIDLSGLDKRLKEVEIIILSDVKNPLCGKNGATYIYGRQKGLKDEELEMVDGWMKHYAEILNKSVQKEISTLESSGAAGGLGAILMALTDAKVYNGISSIIELLKIEEHIKEADIVFTGEGKIDGQSLCGKAPLGIAQLAKKYNKPVIAIVGSVGEQYERALDEGIDLVLPIVNKPMSLSDAMQNAKELLESTAYMALKHFMIWKKIL